MVEPGEKEWVGAIAPPDLPQNSYMILLESHLPHYQKPEEK